MKGLDIKTAAVVKKGFGSRWEFSAIVGFKKDTVRVVFPLDSKPGYTSERKHARLVKRGIAALRSVVLEGEPIPGFWSIYKV